MIFGYYDTAVKLNKALKALDIMLHEPIQKNRENIDASIQQFNVTVNLSWIFLTAIKFRASDGLIPESLNVDDLYHYDVLRKAFIDDDIIWRFVLKDRNLTSHTYDEDLAHEIYEKIKTTYYPFLQQSFDDLIKKLFVASSPDHELLICLKYDDFNK